MDRRDLLKGGLLAAFLPAGWVKAATDIKVKDDVAVAPPKKMYKPEFFSPYFKNFGKAQEITITVNYNLEHLMELGQAAYYRYIDFPVEVIIDVTYERGKETWSGFNPKNHTLKQFDIFRFFNAPFEEGALEYGGSIELDGVKYKLASVSVTDTA